VTGAIPRPSSGPFGHKKTAGTGLFPVLAVPK
jgi:hypothetical protein